MTKSKVKWFDPGKGYGWILSPNGGSDIFFHHSSIVGGATIRDGDSVTYVLSEGRGGKPAATQVALVDATNPNDTSAAVVFGQAAK